MRPCCSKPGFWERATPRALTPAEEAYATRIGRQRYFESVRDGLRDKFGKASMDNHVLGARGELAFCVLFGLEWPASVGAYGQPDVGDYDVKTARRPVLAVKPEEARRLGTKYALMFHDQAAQAFRLLGYIGAAEAAAVPITAGTMRDAHFMSPAELHLFPRH